MTTNGIFQIVSYFAAIALVAAPLGIYMAAVFEGRRTFLSGVLGPVERLSLRLVGVKASDEMNWSRYATAMILFSGVGYLETHLLLRLQGLLPLNPRAFGTNEMTPDLAFNTSVSFTSNTNWQSYVPEATVSYFSNMVSLAMHNWMSAATGIAIAIVVTRGFARHSTSTVGNFWVDIVRATVYVLLPIATLGALLFVYSGVPQNFLPYQEAVALEGSNQLIAQGPVASQEVIKQLGTNGGGFFNANSAHPYENPSPFSNFLTIFLIFLIPGALPLTFGKMVGNLRQGWTLFSAMAAMFLVGVFICTYQEQKGNPQFARLNVDQEATSLQAGGNMEGKEMRFGISSSALFAAVTTGASCGAVNSMHDSYTPLGGLVPLFNILSGEVIFGGVGAGLYGMLMYAVLAVFIAGLMVGRTPEYIGKKIQRFEVQMAMLAVLVVAAAILGFTAISSTIQFDAASAWNRVANSQTYLGPATGNLNNPGPHGFSEILYTYASAAGNNGSAFAGITANTPYYNFTIGLAMLLGRFLMIIPLLAMAGSLAKKRRVPESAGTFPTDNATFVVLLIGVVLIIGALTFFPALSLGPIVEHFQMQSLKLQ